jgi:hypothetical protein
MVPPMVSPIWPVSSKTNLSLNATLVNIIGAKQAKTTNTIESTAQMPEMILIVFIDI